MRLPGVEPGSIALKAIILTVGLQTLACTDFAENKTVLNIDCIERERGPLLLDARAAKPTVV